MPERWRPVFGYEKEYHVSNLGRVKSLPRFVKCRGGSLRQIAGKIMSPGKGENGYMILTLYKNNKRKVVLVHRLVAIAFLPNPENKPEVNHKDDNKMNNRRSNLEWVTEKENHQLALLTGARKQGDAYRTAFLIK